MITFINTFVLKGDRAEFEQGIAEHEEYLRTQAGFVNFEIARSLNRPDEYVNIVQWSSSESHKKLMETPTFQIQIRDLMQVIDVACTEMALETETLTSQAPPPL